MKLYVTSIFDLRSGNIDDLNLTLSFILANNKKEAQEIANKEGYSKVYKAKVRDAQVIASIKASWDYDSPRE